MLRCTRSLSRLLPVAHLRYNCVLKGAYHYLRHLVGINGTLIGYAICALLRPPSLASATSTLLEVYTFVKAAGAVAVIRRVWWGRPFTLTRSQSFF